ncbi:MAG: 30S ribosomal protein S20 [Bradymonadia bacterium]
MANHKSAEKRVRQTEKRRQRNKHVLSTMRTYIKRVRVAIADGNAEDATERLKAATQALAKAASKGVIHRNQARRKISRLTKAVAGLAKA